MFIVKDRSRTKRWAEIGLWDVDYKDATVHKSKQKSSGTPKETPDIDKLSL